MQVPYLENLSRVADCWVFAYPNAGLPNAMGGYDQTGPEMADEVRTTTSYMRLMVPRVPTDSTMVYTHVYVTHLDMCVRLRRSLPLSRRVHQRAAVTSAMRWMFAGEAVFREGPRQRDRRLLRL